MKRCWFGHNWTKWERRNVLEHGWGPIPAATVTVQIRYCLDCGLRKQKDL